VSSTGTMIHLCARLCLHSVLSPLEDPRSPSPATRFWNCAQGVFVYCIYNARVLLVLCASACAYVLHCSPSSLVVASCGAHSCVRLAPGSRLVRDYPPAHNKASSLTDKCINLLPCLHMVPHLATKACILRVSYVCLVFVLRLSLRVSCVCVTDKETRTASRSKGRADFGSDHQLQLFARSGVHRFQRDDGPCLDSPLNACDQA
jgi:hypothetical protein